MFLQQVQEKDRSRSPSLPPDPTIDIPDAPKYDSIPIEVMDHIEEMQKKMNMMQEQMRRNMELMLKSRSNVGASFLHNNKPSMSYAEIKAEIDQKTKSLVEGRLTEKERDAINIEIERLFIML